MKFFLTCLMLVLTLSAFAQKIRFTDPSNEWVTHGSAPECEFYGYYFYGTDTIHHSIRYKKIKILFASLLPTGCGTDDSSYWVREDTMLNKVYYRKMGLGSFDTSEYVLFDYNLNVSDTFRYQSTYSMPYTDSVQRIDSVNINGFAHKVLHMRNNVDLRRYTIVEGIGSLCGPLYTPLRNCFEFDEQLMCFGNNGTKPDFSVYDNGCWRLDSFKNVWSCMKLSVENVGVKKHLNMYPNPASETINVSIAGYTDFPLALVTSDLLGHIVLRSTIEKNGLISISTTELPVGTYILTLGNDLATDKKVISVIH